MNEIQATFFNWPLTCIMGVSLHCEVVLSPALVGFRESYSCETETYVNSENIRHEWGKKKIS